MQLKVDRTYIALKHNSKQSVDSNFKFLLHYLLYKTRTAQILWTVSVCICGWY